MRENNDLYQLISSLSVAEKRYFRVNYGRNSETELLYMVLFDAYLKCESGLDQELKSLLSDYPQVVAKLPWYKQHLEDRLIDCLTSYMESKSPYIKIKKSLAEASMLLDRRMLDMADKRLDRAYRMSLDYDDALSRLEVHEWKRRMGRIDAERRKGDAYTELVGYIEQELKSLNNLYYWVKFNAKAIMMLSRYSAERDPERRAAVRNQIDSMTEDNFDESAGFQTKVIRNEFWVRLAIAEGNWADAFQYYKYQLDLYDAFPAFKQDLRYGYLSSIVNYLAGCQRVGRQDEFLKWLDVLQKVPVLNKWEEAERFIFWAICKINYHLSCFEFDLAARMEDIVEKGLAEYKGLLKPKNVFSCIQNLCVAFLPLGQFGKARKWVFTILNYTEPDHTNDIIRFSMVYQLLIDYELDDLDLMEAQVRSLKRTWSRKGKLFAFEKTMVKHLIQLARKSDDESKKVVFYSLRTELAELRKDPYERHALGMTEFSWWVDNRLGLVGMPGQ